MRTAFADELTQLAQADERIVLLAGDIGNTLFDGFKAVAPTRFFNCGIAEQNMVSMASGLAKSGFRPVCFTIAPFLTARCFEQIKIDLGYHNAPVVLAGVGAGLCYANLGPTHQALDDIAILRTVPNLKIAVPATPNECRRAVEACLRENGPTYLRLGRDGELGYPNDNVFAFGSANLVVSRASIAPVAILACGPIATALQGLPWTVTSAYSVKPLNDVLLETIAPETLVVTVEEHGLAGGFGSAVAEWFADRRIPQHVLRIGTPDEFLHAPMTPAEARDYCGLTPTQIARRIRDELAKLR